ncbi:MAG TPA: hypothetical protein VF456_20425 [Vicinamibacterales bacterium]
MSQPMGTQGGAFVPSADYTFTGAVTVSGSLTATGTNTISSPTISSPTITSPTITGTTSIGSGATLTSPTVTTPTVTGGTATGTTLASTINSDYKLVPATTYTSNNTPAIITGLSWTVAAAASYVFELNLPVTMTTNGGLSVAFALTTATLASINYQTYAATASDNTTAVSTNGTTATSGTLVFDSVAAAYTHVNIKGAFVTTLGGTFQWNASQHTSAGGGDVTSLLVNGYAKLTRVA